MTDSAPTIERVILGSLIHNPDYYTVVLPHTRREFFESDSNAAVFELIESYHAKYGEMPSIEAAEVELANAKGLSEEIFRESKSIIDKMYDEKVKMGLLSQRIDWLLDQTETRFKDRSCYLAVIESLEILEGSSKLTRESIPELLAKAVAISFSSEIGHDYLNDWEKRFRAYNKAVEKIPFSLHMLNKVTDGGHERKTLSLFVAGCVHPDTPIKIQVDGVVRIVAISDVKEMLGETDVHVDTPDGWQPITAYVEKGDFVAYSATSSDGRKCIVNENHLFETKIGWVSADDLTEFRSASILMDDGKYHSCRVERTNDIVPIVDIQVGHENHRYYANGFSSHNTNVGKTMCLTNEAAHLLMIGKNVLYVTLEMGEEKIGERVDAKLLQVPMSTVRKIDFEKYRNNMLNLQSRTQGKLFIQEFPPRTITVRHVEQLLNDLKAKRNFVPDVICVDYLTLLNSYSMKGGGYENLYILGKLVAEELRALAIRKNVSILSASQTNRDGQTNTDFDLTDLGESHAISQTADFMIGLISTPELELLAQLRMKLLKSRFGPLNEPNSFVAGMDRSKMTLYDLDYKEDRNTPPVDAPQISQNTKNTGNFKGFDFGGDDDE